VKAEDIHYLLLDALGHVFHASESYAEAYAVGRGSGRPLYLLADDPRGQERERLTLAANPRAARMEPLDALRMTGLPQVRSTVVRMPLQEAYETIAPFFEEARAAAPVMIEQVRQRDHERRLAKWERTGRGEMPVMKPMALPRGLLGLKEMLQPGRGLLTSNAKLHKSDLSWSKQAVALGLALVPEQTVFLGESSGGVSVWPIEPVPAPHVARNGAVLSTLCRFASDECRRMCLVYSGHNQANIENNGAKMAKAKALVTAPEAFVRVLVEAIRAYARSTKSRLLGFGQAEKFCRLNVFSDIPWEMFCRDPGASSSWLFKPKLFDGKIHFYDYTKVPGRYDPHLDLSFSCSGTNLRHCDAELRTGKRIVMVFVAPEYREKRDLARGIPHWDALTDDQKKRAWIAYNPLPETIAHPGLLDGVPLSVTDGDITDIRPWDPPAVRVVGLRFKVPQVANFNVGRALFLVRGEVFEVSGQRRFAGSEEHGFRYVLPDTPLARRDQQAM